MVRLARGRWRFDPGAPWRQMPSRSILVVLLSFGICGACVPVLPTPPLAAHAGERPLRVPYPPPPTQPEVIPSMPTGLKHAVWVDGSWAYDGDSWVWEPGRWQELPPGGAWAPPLLMHLEGGAFAWYPGRWVLPRARP